jgi:hypothetical protein
VNGGNLCDSKLICSGFSNNDERIVSQNVHKLLNNEVEEGVEFTFKNVLRTKTSSAAGET